MAYEISRAGSLKPNSIIVVLSFAVLVVSFWNRNDIPGRIDVLPALANEPEQTRSNKADFQVNFRDIDYKVRPKYRYALEGLVVSFRHHDGDTSRMHRLSNDHLNMLDVCVVWGSNASPELLKKLTFWNGVFTCNVKTRDWEAWDAFDMVALSNNHLLSDDLWIRDQVQKIRIGDQIRVEGWLSSYGTRTGNERGTSTTREDTGDGACETIWVDDFSITRKATSNWRLTMWGSLLVLSFSLAVHFSRPYRPHSGGD